MLNLEILIELLSLITPIKDKLQRNEKIIQILKQYNLDPEHPPNDFNGVYVYALVEYGLGKPKALLEIFRQQEIKTAFREAFNSNNPGILLSSIDCFLESYALGDEIKGLSIDLKREVAAFAAIFIEVAKKTRTPAEVLTNQEINSLHQRVIDLQERLDRLPTLEGIRTEIARLVEGEEGKIKESKGITRQGNGDILFALSQQMRGWFETVNYRFEKYEVWQDNYFEWIINVPLRRNRYDRVLIRGIEGEARLSDAMALRQSVETQKTDEGWLVSARRISRAARDEVDKNENRHLECFTFDELIDQDANFDDYLDWLEQEVKRRGIDQKYVPLACIKEEFDSVTKQRIGISRYGDRDGWIDGYLDVWLDDPAKEHISILGEFGTGKTWCSFHYAWVALQRYREAEKRGVKRPRLPLVILLRDYAKALNVENVLAGFFFTQHNIRLNSEVFEQLNRMGKLLLIFDGFDEMAAKVDKQQMINNFWELAKVVVPGAKVILTCRTEHFPEARQGRALLNAELKASIANLTGETPQFEVLELEKFDDEQIRQVLSFQAEGETVEKVMGNSQLLDLARRPVMSDLIIEALPDIEAGKPVDMSRVYLYAVRRKMERDIKSERTFTSLVDKMYFLCELAWEMLSTEQMSLNYRLFPDRIRRLFGSTVEEQKDLDHWHYDMMAQTMLVRNADGDYTPAHRSLLEFFVAYKFAGELGVLADDFVEVVRNQFGDNQKTIAQQFSEGDSTTQQFSETESRSQQFSPTDSTTQQFSETESSSQQFSPTDSTTQQFWETESRSQHFSESDSTTQQFSDTESRSQHFSETESLPQQFSDTESRSQHFSETESLPQQFSETESLPQQFSDTESRSQQFCESESRSQHFSEGDSTTQQFSETESSPQQFSETESRSQHFSETESSSQQFCETESRSQHFSETESSSQQFCETESSTQQFSWGEYFQHHVDGKGEILALEKIKLFKTESLEKLKETFGLTPLTKAVLDLLVGMVDKGNGVEKLLGVIEETKGKSEAEVGYVGGNAATLLLKIDNTALENKDLSATVIKGADFIDASLRGVNFAGANLSDCIFPKAFGAVFTVAYSPDGKYFATGDANCEIILWRVSDNQPISIFKGHKGWVRSVIFSPDGNKLVSGSFDHTIRIWDIPTVKCFKTCKEHSSRIHSVALSSDGKTIASASSDQNVKLWNIETGECFKTFQGHTHSVRGVSISPDNKTLASVSHDKSLKLWDIPTGKCLKTLEGHTDKVTTVRFSPDYKIVATGSDDGTIKLWDVQTGKCIKTLQCHRHWVRSIAFNSDGKILASVSYDTTGKLWNVVTGECLKILEGHTNWIRAVAFSPDDTTLITAGDDQTIRQWDVLSGECIAISQGCASAVNSVAISPDITTLVSSSEERTLKLWDINTGKLLKSLQGHKFRVNSVAFSPDGKIIASVSYDTTVKLWDINTGECRNTLHRHSWAVNCIAFAPDGNTIATGGGARHQLKLWDITTGKCLNTLYGHKDWIWSVSFSSDGKILASGSNDESVRLWDVNTGKCFKTLQWDNQGVNTLAFSGVREAHARRAYRNILAIGCRNSKINLWDIDTEDNFEILEGHTDSVLSVAFSPDGRTVASGSIDETVKLWDIQTKKCLKTFKWDNDGVNGVAISSDGKILAAGGWNGIIKIWNIKTGKCIKTLSNKPYTNMNITGATGLTPEQKSSLKALGALEE